MGLSESIDRRGEQGVAVIGGVRFGIGRVLRVDSLWISYAACRSPDGRWFALKVLRWPRTSPRYPLAMDCAKEERRWKIACAGRCPFLIRVHATWHALNLPIMMEPIMTGGSLRYALALREDEFVRGGLPPLRPDHVKVIVACLLLGLEFLHSSGVCHGDLNMESVLLDRRGYAHLSGFHLGLASASSSASLLHLRPSDPRYVSKERKQGDGRVGGMGAPSTADDMWALGCILYCLMGGCEDFLDQPTSQDDDSKTIVQLLSAGTDPSRLPSLHALLLLSGLLASAPSRLTLAEAKCCAWLQSTAWEDLWRSAEDVSSTAQACAGWDLLPEGTVRAPGEYDMLPQLAWPPSSPPTPPRPHLDSSGQRDGDGGVGCEGRRDDGRREGEGGGGGEAVGTGTIWHEWDWMSDSFRLECAAAWHNPQLPSQLPSHLPPALPPPSHTQPSQPPALSSTSSPSSAPPSSLEP